MVVELVVDSPSQMRNAGATTHDRFGGTRVHLKMNVNSLTLILQRGPFFRSLQPFSAAILTSLNRAARGHSGFTTIKDQ